MQECERPIKILIVEDNPNDVRLINEYISPYRLLNEVYWARDGEETLKVARRIVPDLILLDMILPRKSGQEVLHEIRSDPKLQSTSVVIMADSNSEVDYLRTLVPKADAFVTKPLNLDKLASIVSQIDCFGVAILRTIQ